jgi:hypothetical protein
MPEEFKPWPHQALTIAFAADRPAVFDTSSAGTGKTMAWATVLQQRLGTDASRGLIVCPKSLMRTAWRDELNLYTDMTVALAEPPIESRMRALETNTDVVIINTDALPWLVGLGRRRLKRLLGQRPMAVLDESHLLKNSGAGRTKAALELSEWIPYKTCLSGTPAPNTVRELWSQAKILDGGKRLGRNEQAFVRVMTEFKMVNGRIETVDREDAHDLVYGMLNDIVIGHRFDEVMPHVPPMDHHILYYDMPDAAMAQYHKLRRETALKLAGGGAITAVHAADLANKLLQFASGAVYTSGDGKSWEVFDNGRYALIGELIEARDQTVVFCSWNHQKAQIVAELKRRKLPYAVFTQSGAQRAEAVDDLQAGKVRALLMHPKSGAWGLTLTQAKTVIYASPLYNAAWKEQGDARIRRGRQNMPTESIVILARGTRDDLAYEVFVGRRTNMDALNELLAGAINER